MIAKTGIVLIAVTFLVSAMGTLSFAGEPGPINKLSYGLGNLVTGVVEIPKQIGASFQKDHNGFEAMTTGLLRGVVYFVGRTLAGAVDTVFFMIPPFDKPLMEPIITAY